MTDSPRHLRTNDLLIHLERSITASIEKGDKCGANKRVMLICMVTT
jgi:hypothetical protein